MHRLRLMRSSSLPNCAYKSTAPKKESHYDVLKVNSTATQNEVKAAYYELSKKYHPDRNQSESAKESFRKVSEAYEVLGNHNSRKNYDRIMSIRGIAEDSPANRFTYRKTANTHDPRMRVYREEAESYGTASLGSATFNYDAWTRAHYGDSFERSRRLGTSLNRLRREKEEKIDRRKRDIVNEEPTSQGPTVFISTILLFAISLLLYSKTENYDDPKSKR